MRTIGLLGGTFDPIHYGHLRIAEELGEALGLEVVRLLPAGTPPHRAPPVASAQQRLDMVRLAISGNPRLVVDEYEVFKTTPCYMVDTLRTLRAEAGAQASIVLCLGADAFAGLPTWHAWQSLFDLAHLAIAHRPGFSEPGWLGALPDALRSEVEARRVAPAGSHLGAHGAEFHASASGRIGFHAVTQLEISASALREKCRDGESLRYLMPDAVIEYIQQHQLYR